MVSVRKEILTPCFGWLPRPFGRYFTAKMTAQEELTLSPLQKMLRYGRIPWKFIIHSLIVIITSVQVCGMANQNTGFNQDTRGTFYNLMLPRENFSYSEVNLPIFAEGYFAYSISDLKTILKFQVDSYFKFHHDSLGNFAYYEHSGDRQVKGVRNSDLDPDGSVLLEWDSTDDLPKKASNASSSSSSSDGEYANPSKVRNPRLRVRMSREDDASKFDDYNYWLSTDDPLGPLNTSFHNLRDMFTRLYEMELTLSFVQNEPQLYRAWGWDVSCLYDAHNRGGRINININIDARTPDHRDFSLWKYLKRNPLFWLNFVIIILAICSLILSARAISLSWRLYNNVKRTHGASANVQVPWSRLPWRLKMKFFRLWFAVTMMGNVLNITGAVLNLISLLLTHQTFHYASMFSGLGCALAWVNMIRYLEYDTRYYMLINTLKVGMPNVCRFLVCVGPVFLGYALFGVAVFNQVSPKFWTVGNACVALFAIANGDIIQDTYTEIYGGGWLISRIYLYSFISLFIYVVLNVFIQLVQDGYKLARIMGNPNHPKYHQVRKLDGMDTGVDPETWGDILRRAQGTGGSGSSKTNGRGVSLQMPTLIRRVTTKRFEYPDHENHSSHDSVTSSSSSSSDSSSESSSDDDDHGHHHRSHHEQDASAAQQQLASINVDDLNEEDLSSPHPAMGEPEHHPPSSSHPSHHHHHHHRDRSRSRSPSAHSSHSHSKRKEVVVPIYDDEMLDADPQNQLNSIFAVLTERQERFNQETLGILQQISLSMAERSDDVLMLQQNLPQEELEFFAPQSAAAILNRREKKRSGSRKEYSTNSLRLYERSQHGQRQRRKSAPKGAAVHNLLSPESSHGSATRGRKRKSRPRSTSQTSAPADILDNLGTTWPVTEGEQEQHSSSQHKSRELVHIPEGTPVNFPTKDGGARSQSRGRNHSDPGTPRLVVLDKRAGLAQDDDDADEYDADADVDEATLQKRPLLG